MTLLTQLPSTSNTFLPFFWQSFKFQYAFFSILRWPLETYSVQRFMNFICSQFKSNILYDFNSITKLTNKNRYKQLVSIRKSNTPLVVLYSQNFCVQMDFFLMWVPLHFILKFRLLRHAMNALFPVFKHFLFFFFIFIFYFHW